MFTVVVLRPVWLRPEPVASAFAPMALDTGERIFLISSTGITVAQLARVPLSISSANPSLGTTGTLITIRGSGFESRGEPQIWIGYVYCNFRRLRHLTGGPPRCSARGLTRNSFESRRDSIFIRRFVPGSVSDVARLCGSWEGNIKSTPDKSSSQDLAHCRKYSMIDKAAHTRYCLRLTIHGKV